MLVVRATLWCGRWHRRRTPPLALGPIPSQRHPPAPATPDAFSIQPRTSIAMPRRASAWQAMSGLEGVDPSLTSSAHIGFALPVIKIGWGVSVSLTVTTSSLLRFATHAAELVLS